MPALTWWLLALPLLAGVLLPLQAGINPATIQEATAFLQRSSLPIAERRQWPPGGLPQYDLRGNIPLNHRAQPGMTLCVWGDAGWGGLVRDGKYQFGRFDDALVAACAQMVAEWGPHPRPTWVTCIPSLRHPDLVPDFARRLAGLLGLPFHEVLKKSDSRPEQKSMKNSAQQARNVDGSLHPNGQPIPDGPVLLVDDMVDSRWTLTIAAWLLRSNGSGEVWPMALSLTGQDE